MGLPGLLHLGLRTCCTPISICLGSDGGGWRASLATRTFRILELEELASWALAFLALRQTESCGVLDKARALFLGGLAEPAEPWKEKQGTEAIQERW